jgi:hypothetical protein
LKYLGTVYDRNICSSNMLGHIRYKLSVYSLVRKKNIRMIYMGLIICSKYGVKNGQPKIITSIYEYNTVI